MSAHNGVTTEPHQQHWKGGVGFQGPNMKGQWQLCPESYRKPQRAVEDEKKESGHLGRKRKEQNYWPVLVGKEEDKENKSNDLEIKKSASKKTA